MTANTEMKKGHPDQLGGDGMTLLNTLEDTNMSITQGTCRAPDALVEPPTDSATVEEHPSPLAEASALARKWQPAEHPYRLCQPSRCLVEPRIDRHGRATANVGYHRASIVTVEAEFADAIEVGVGVSEDVLGVNLEDAIVHVRAIDPDEEPDDVPWYVALSADEAEALGEALLSRAKLLRAIKQRHTEEAAMDAAAEAADEEKVRALVRRMASNPEGRAALEQLFDRRGVEEGRTPAAQSSATAGGRDE